MRKHVFFCFALFILNCTFSQAQQGLGEVIINGGIGYSPTFSGAFEGYGSYPIANTVSESPNFHEGVTVFTCSSVSPYIGGTIDIGLAKWISIGFAISSQNEIVNWTLDNAVSSYPYNSDQISRTNIAGRLSLHFGSNWANKNFDPYCGLRLGISMWDDTPSPNNNGYKYFITAASVNVPSCQFFGGIRGYLNENIGLHIEIGVGSPYLLEGGITLRARSKKKNTGVAPTVNPQ